MRNLINTVMLGLAALFCFAGPASATTYTGESLHGSTGELTLVGSVLTWSIDTTGFDDLDATATGHTLLTEVAFKISGMTEVSLVDTSIGTLYYPSNVNQGTNGCDIDGSNASFVCVILSNPITATTNQIFSVEFNLVGNPIVDADSSYRGKYGRGTGWIISENGASAPIPEPSAALVFGIGGAIVARRSVRR